MLDTAGPELTVVNTSEKPIALKADETVTIIPDKGEEASSEVFPINFDGLSKVPLVPIFFTLPFPCSVFRNQDCSSEKSGENIVNIVHDTEL